MAGVSGSRKAPIALQMERRGYSKQRVRQVAAEARKSQSGPAAACRLGGRLSWEAAGYPPALHQSFREPSMTRPTLAALSLCLLAACGGASPKELSDEADKALRGGDPAKAQKLAEEGQEAMKGGTPQRDLAWQLERVRLEALASQGKLTEVRAGLTTASIAYADQVKADFYAKLGREMADAGKTVESLELVEDGKKKFPDMTSAFDGLIAQLKQKAESGADDALMARMRQLGYLGGNTAPPPPAKP